jgi:excinuclease UvrABC nuclease subunit
MNPDFFDVQVQLNIRIIWSYTFKLSNVSQQYAPSGPGIYEIGLMEMNKDTHSIQFKPLYLGSTNNLYRRLSEHSSHRGGNKHIDEHAQELFHARFFSCTNEYDIEQQILRTFGTGTNGRYLYNGIGSGTLTKLQSSKTTEVTEEQNQLAKDCIAWLVEAISESETGETVMKSPVTVTENSPKSTQRRKRFRITNYEDDEQEDYYSDFAIERE